MKYAKTYFAALIGFVLMLGCAAEQTNQETTHAEYMANDSLIRGLDYKTYVKLSSDMAKDTQALKDTWVLWKAENWSALEAYIDSAKLNSGYPPAEGFVNVEVVSLDTGAQIDRYNSIYGQFFAPKGTPFGERSLKAEDRYHPYTAYRVEKQIDSVLKGKIIPWYGEPGMGIQYMTRKHDNELLAQGYLIMTDSVGPTKPPKTQ